jgi:WD40 repeat protein
VRQSSSGSPLEVSVNDGIQLYTCATSYEYGRHGQNCKDMGPYLWIMSKYLRVSFSRHYSTVLIVSCLRSHDAGVVSLRWHVTKPTIVSASLDRCIRLWDARSGAIVISCMMDDTGYKLCAGIKLLELTGHTNLVTNFSLRSFAGTDSTLPVPPTQVETEAVSTGSRREDVIVTVSDDFTAKVFSLDISSLAE